MKIEDIVKIADPRVLQIPIHENHEPLFDLRNQAEILIGPSPEVENNTTYTYVRLSIFDRLKAANKMLPSGLRLCLYEGLRTVALQEMLFNAFWDKVCDEHPDWDREEVYNETIKLASPVISIDGRRNIPPHATGAAVDVYLVDSSVWQPLEMGIHPKDAFFDIDGSVCQTYNEKISEEAKKNRQILSDVMSFAGFVNLPTEYWHWSYGDRYWAFHQNKAAALYGIIEPVNDR